MDATYRSDLRELNEINFARFDAKLEQRAAQLDAKIDQRTAQLDAKIDQRTAQLDAKIDQRAAEVKAELRQEIGVLRTEMREGFARTDARLDVVSATLGLAIQQSQTTLLKWMFGGFAVTLGTMITLIKL